ncbi:MAG: hypothetical protein JJV98_03005, partial [Desulfosarcina sp.]|nr:hypothetical protein [Desulfobacterales bacterium]
MGKSTDSAPQLPTVVHRRRLLKRLEGVIAPGIVVVRAQAAQGKSTLIADYLETTGARACWIHLGPDDMNPEHFGGHLFDACRPFLTPESARPAAFDTAAGRTTRVITDLFQDLPTDLNLVFDGWQHLESPTRAVELIDAILAARPVDGCVYLISRENLPLKLQRNRMRRQALLLTGKELAFTEDEIGAFFQATHGITLDPDRLRQIHHLTAGWTGGLVLLAEELHRHPGRPDEILAVPTLPDRIHTEAGHYFEEEVYRRQPKAMRTFLAGAALLDTVEADLMHKWLGRREADRLFAEADRQNLFLQILNGDPRHWTFRFNPLFRAFLLSGRQKSLPETSARKFLKKAAGHYDAAGDVETAVTYFLKAGEISAAVRGITRIGLQLSFEGRFAEIEGWMSILPQTASRDDPWLSLLQAIAFRIRGGRRTVGKLQAVAQAFAREDLIRGRMFALAYLIETAVFIGFDPAVRTRWIAEGEALVKDASQLPHYAYAKALLWQQIGFGSIAETANLSKGLSACRNAVILGKRIGAHGLVANALTIAAHAHVRAGEFEQARDSLDAAQALDQDAVFPEYGVLRDLTRIHLELIRGRLTPAGDLLKRVESDIDSFGLIILYPVFLEACGLLQIYAKQYAALEKTRRHMCDVATLLNNPAYKALSLWLAGFCCY